MVCVSGTSNTTVSHYCGPATINELATHCGNCLAVAGVVLTDLAMNLTLNFQATNPSGGITGTLPSTAEPPAAQRSEAVQDACKRASVAKAGGSAQAVPPERVVVLTDVAAGSSEDAFTDAEGAAQGAMCQGMLAAESGGVRSEAAGAAAAAVRSVRVAAAEEELLQRLNAITPEEAAVFVCEGLMAPPPQVRRFP